MMAVHQLSCSLHGTLKTRKQPKPARTKAPSDPKADHIAYEAAEPADHCQGTETRRSRMRCVARDSANSKLCEAA